MADIDSLNIRITSSSNTAQGAITTLIKRLSELKKAVSDVGDASRTVSALQQISAAAQNAGQGAEGIKKLSAALKGLKNVAAVSIPAQTLESLKNLKELGDVSISLAVPKHIGENIAAIGKGAETLTDESIDRFRQLAQILVSLNGVDTRHAASGIRAAFNGAGQQPLQESPGGNVPALTETTGTLGLIKLALSDLQARILSLASVKGVIQGIGELFKTLGKIIQKVGSAAKKAFVALVKASPIGQFSASMKRAAASASKLLASLGRVAFYRAVRAAIKAITDGIKEGTENMYEFSRLMGDEFAAVMDNVSSKSLTFKNALGAVAASFITAVYPAVMLIMNALIELGNRFAAFISMLGGKSSYTKALDASTTFAAATGSAANSAKELKRTLFGFDELNVLPSDTGSSSGSGKAVPDYASMFKTAEDIPEWMMRIQEALASKKFYDAGMLFAQYFNDIISAFDAKAFGTKIGVKLKQGVDIALGVMQTFDFKAVGAKVAGMLNGLLDGFDPIALGNLFAAKWQLLFDLIAGFVNEFDWSTLAVSAGDFINGWFEGISWADVGTAVGNLIAGLAKLIIGLIKQIRWLDIGSALLDGLVSAFTAIKDNAGPFIKAEVVDPIVGWLKRLFGIASPSTVMEEIGHFLVDGLFQGLGSIGASFDSWWNDKVLPWFSAEKWKALGSGAVSAIKDGLNSITLPRFHLEWGIASWAGDFFGKTVNVNIPYPDLSFYAKGGIVDSAALFGSSVIGENGREAIIPLENHDEWISSVAGKLMTFMSGSGLSGTVAQAVYEAVVKGMNEVSVDVNASLSLDGKQLSSSVTRYQKQANRAMGASA